MPRFAWAHSIAIGLTTMIGLQIAQPITMRQGIVIGCTIAISVILTTVFNHMARGEK